MFMMKMSLDAGVGVGEGEGVCAVTIGNGAKKQMTAIRNFEWFHILIKVDEFKNQSFQTESLPASEHRKTSAQLIPGPSSRVPSRSRNRIRPGRGWFS